jgi:hypothetical protein
MPERFQLDGGNQLSTSRHRIWKDWSPVWRETSEWFRLLTKIRAWGSFALFHTINAIPSVILHIDENVHTDKGYVAYLARASLSPLPTPHL